MEKQKRMNSLKFALNNEIKERQFYLKHAKRSKHPVAKFIFEQIAEEELDHYNRLIELEKHWKKGKKWPETIPAEIHESKIKNFMNGVLKKIDETKMVEDDELAAIRRGIDFEAKGASFYAQMSEMMTEASEREFFDLLSRLEREHYLSLKDTEEYLVDPYSWHKKKERHGFDGG